MSTDKKERYSAADLIRALPIPEPIGIFQNSIISILKSLDIDRKDQDLSKISEKSFVMLCRFLLDTPPSDNYYNRTQMALQVAHQLLEDAYPSNGRKLKNGRRDSKGAHIVSSLMNFNPAIYQAFYSNAIKAGLKPIEWDVQPEPTNTGVNPNGPFAASPEVNHSTLWAERFPTKAGNRPMTKEEYRFLESPTGSVPFPK